jgi:hypothetical protein
MSLAARMARADEEAAVPAAARAMEVRARALMDDGETDG